MTTLLLFLIPLQALALTCFDSSSKLLVSVTKDKANLHFHFSAGRGYEAIPQFEGPVSANDQGMLRFQIESLKEVGDQFEVKIPLSACDLKKSAEGIFACYHEGQLGNTNLNFSSLTAYRTIQTHASGEFESQTFRMLMGRDDRLFFAMPFPSHSCSGSL